MNGLLWFCLESLYRLSASGWLYFFYCELSPLTIPFISLPSEHLAAVSFPFFILSSLHIGYRSLAVLLFALACFVFVVSFHYPPPITSNGFGFG